MEAKLVYYVGLYRDRRHGLKKWKWKDGKDWDSFSGLCKNWIEGYAYSNYWLTWSRVFKLHRWASISEKEFGVSWY